MKSLKTLSILGAFSMLIVCVSVTNANLIIPPCGLFPGGECWEGMVCNIESCRVGATGVCVPEPEFCTRLWKPVCGCDGVTYPNDCERLKTGTPLHHKGECTNICGPFPGGQCQDKMICNIESCGFGATGVCVPEPDFCTYLWKPVCGCDGVTYPNDCERLKQGVPLAHEGECNQYQECHEDVDCAIGEICEIHCGNRWCSGVCVRKPLN